MVILAVGSQVAKRSSGKHLTLSEVDAALEAASGTGRYEWRVAEDRLIWSSGLLAIYGLKEPPGDEGLFYPLIHPDDRVRVEATTASFLSSTAAAYSQSFRIVRPDGGVRFVLDRGVIERDQSERAIVIRGVNVDLTDLPETHPLPVDETVVQGFAELQALYAEAPLGLGLLDRELRFVRINAALAEINGFAVEDHIGCRVWDLLPDLRKTGEPALLQVLATGLPLRKVLVTGETPARPGVTRAWHEHFYPLRGNDGLVQGIGIVCEEVTERLAAERLLSESEARYRALFDALDEGFCVVEVSIDRPDGRIDYRVVEANPAFYQRTGFPEAIFGKWLRSAVPELEDHWYETYGRVAKTGEPARFEQRSDVLGRWFDVYAFRIDGPDDRRVAILFNDISERKRHEESTQLLMLEANHRAKNTLALVQAIARQTAAFGRENFVERFDARVQALAASQDLLMQTDWEGAELGDLIRSQLTHFKELIGGRIALSGAPTLLGPQATQTLGLAIHELATNSAKYGALSTAVGRMDVFWDVTMQGGAEQLVMSWSEKNGPPVVAPTRKGFGQRVVKTMVERSLSGTVTLEYAPTGLVWQLRCPLEAVRAK